MGFTVFYFSFVVFVFFDLLIYEGKVDRFCAVYHLPHQFCLFIFIYNFTKKVTIHLNRPVIAHTKYWDMYLKRMKYSNEEQTRQCKKRKGEDGIPLQTIKKSSFIHSYSQY